MAVRRQLRRLFQEPHISGVITVERPPPAPATPPPSPSPAEAPLRRRGLRPEDCAVFQCRGCRAVLADSLHLCAQEERRLGLLACLRVTEDVAWEDALLVGLEGALLGCAYNALYCRLCGSMVGFILYSAFSNLAYLRGLFCFFKESILCYLLKNKITIEASKVNFPTLTLKEQLGKLKEKLVVVHMRLELLIKKMEELKQKDMAESMALHQMQLP
ncbi:LOW QUALITY PROTEIN: protein Mis18-beta [Cygnus atratus]|uniref:LOW QUALITY PROTEIN: protein Mis18-beta n=1 Tax=Cygnus atratus TaxID=8868 RepID=UPI0015D62246|nr:LOW QUALITY PROTEIN: protein Mis18-beta [Cygnus atratus]